MQKELKGDFVKKHCELTVVFKFLYFVKMFKNTDVSYALLKGAFLINVYDIGMRTSNDVDILVNQNQISEITDILKKNGFVQGNTRGGKIYKGYKI